MLSSNDRSRIIINNNEKMMHEYNLALKRLEIWQHLESLKINLDFNKGTTEEKNIWCDKTPVLQATLNYLNGGDVQSLYDPIAANKFMYA